ncbi:MAG: hypothetical protein ACM3OB_10875 [Acidobacteriota bacterium]
MSRIPRVLETLKNGFTAEAASAARYRAFAGRAERDGLVNLARHWRELAEAKDALAVRQLEAAGQVRGERLDLAAALAEEQYENDVLYPKLIAASALDPEAAAILEAVLEAQRQHAERMEALREALTATPGDVPASLPAAAVKV